MQARKAKLPDVPAIHRLIAQYSGDGTLLPRSLAELCENVRDFIVVEHEGEIIACGALHLYGQHLTEVRSIAVDPRAQGRGAGRVLIDALLAEAEEQSVRCVCLFTRIPGFFARFGFRVAQKEELPDKIYKDCVNCSRRHACDEIAMVRGELPQIAILQPPRVIDIPLPRILTSRA